MSDFPEKAEDKVNTLGVVCIGLATTAVLWASVVALQAYYEDTEGEIAAQRASIGRATEVRTLKAAQTADMSETRRADGRTLKRLSIDTAKIAVVKAAQAGAPTWIPTLGPLDVATVPAVPGKPADDATVEPAPAPAPAVPALPDPALPPAGAAPDPGSAPTAVPLPAGGTL